jgi:hypothetical protein
LLIFVGVVLVIFPALVLGMTFLKKKYFSPSDYIEGNKYNDEEENRVAPVLKVSPLNILEDGKLDLMSESPVGRPSLLNARTKGSYSALTSQVQVESYVSSNDNNMQSAVTPASSFSFSEFIKRVKLFGGSSQSSPPETDAYDINSPGVMRSAAPTKNPFTMPAVVE